LDNFKDAVYRTESSLSGITTSSSLSAALPTRDRLLQATITGGMFQCFWKRIIVFLYNWAETCAMKILPIPLGTYGLESFNNIYLKFMQHAQAICTEFELKIRKEEIEALRLRVSRANS